MGKFSDTSQQTDTEPNTAPALLRSLNSLDVLVEQQMAAPQIWLKDNEPGQSLRVSLRRNGYGLLLDEMDERKGRKKGSIRAVLGRVTRRVPR